MRRLGAVYVGLLILLIGCNPVSPTDQSRVPARQPLLTVSKTGSGTVKSTPAGIDCGTNCSTAFDSGVPVSLVAIAEGGWRFAGWGGACTGAGGCNVTLTADSAVSATFEKLPSPPPSQHQLSVARAGDGTGRITSSPPGIDCGTTCVAAMPAGTRVILTAAAETGSQFAGWSGDCSGSGDCSVTLDGERSVVAAFAKVSPPASHPALFRIGRLPEVPYQVRAGLQSVQETFVTVALQEAGGEVGRDPQVFGFGLQERSGELDHRVPVDDGAGQRSDLGDFGGELLELRIVTHRPAGRRRRADRVDPQVRDFWIHETHVRKTMRG